MACSAAAPSSIAAPVPVAPVDAPAPLARPAAVVPCIPPAASPAVALPEHVPALASVPVALVAVPGSGSVPAQVEHPASCRLPAKHRALRAPARMLAVDASNIPRRKKAP